MPFHQVTFSTAGSANHADVSPENLGHDPLWNPGLEADFIADPRLSGEWSPFQDARHFVHQAKVFAHNAANCLGHVAAWLTLSVMATLLYVMQRWRAGRKLLTGDDRMGVWWCAAGLAVYCGGYCMVNLESRYIAPVISPLLCVSALLLIRSAVAGITDKSMALQWTRLGTSWAGLMLALPFSVQDMYRFERAALHHTQSAKYATFSEAATQMEQAHMPAGPMAANEFHVGLALAYADDRLASYLGAPRVAGNAGVMEQLQKSGARVYVRWVDRQTRASLDGFIPQRPWALQLSVEMEGLSVKRKPLGPSWLEVYVLPTLPPAIGQVPSEIDRWAALNYVRSPVPAVATTKHEHVQK